MHKLGPIQSFTQVETLCSMTVKTEADSLGRDLDSILFAFYFVEFI